VERTSRTTRRVQQSLSGSRCGTNESESTAHSATSAPKRSRRPRGSDRFVMGVHDWCAGPAVLSDLLYPARWEGPER
jgi:hypothetical protein